MFGGLDIIEVTGRAVLDSWSNPAVEAEVVLENGAHGRALASLGGPGNGEEEALLVNDRLSEAVLYEDASDQGCIDRLLLKAAEDASLKMKGRCGVLALSMAAARAAGAGLGLPLYRYLGGTSLPVMPVPMMTMICGGDRDKGLDFSEFMVVPKGAKTYSDGLRMGAEIYQTLKKLLSMSGHQTSVGEGGGFAPDMKSSEEALHYLTDAFRLSGYKPGRDALVAINAGADRLYKKDQGIYHFSKESKKDGILINRDQKDMISYYLRLADGFPVCAVLDGLWKEDLDGRSRLQGLLENRVLMVSEDAFAAHGVMIRMERAGTVTGALEMVEKARKTGHKVIISNDHGETEEPFLADLAAAVHADYIKCGAPCRGECTAKYNELLRIEEFYSRHG
ncbi:phosphopyruvate hydratase [Lachnospiraceae bacterium 54-53]